MKLEQMNLQGNTNTREKKLKGIVRTLFVIALSIIFLCILGIVFVFYSPYTKLKQLFVTSAMTSMNHQYLARIFLSEDEIQKIMKENSLNESGQNTSTGQITPYALGSNEIELININMPTFKGFLLIVKDPSRISIGTTGNLGKKGMQVEDIVKEYGAVGGINAGGFVDVGGHGKGGSPDGILIENFKTLYTDNSSKHKLIGLDRNNILVLGNYSIGEIANMGIRDAVSFHPFLIVNGTPTITKGNGGWGVAPRTAIGQRKDGAILLLAIDGRQLGSIGATLKDVQDIMLNNGAYNAANLDGGASTTMVLNGKMINNPSSKYGPRNVPSAFIIK